jgi:hypothetical protein
MDVTDHDTGMQGPLMTFARERGLKVTVWPHSSVSVVPFPSSKTTQKKSCVVSERNEYVRLGSDEANAEIISFPGPSRRDRESINILLMFNHLEDSAGITMIDVVEFKRAYKQFKLSLLGSGLTYRVRHKPKHGYIDVFEDSADPLATGNLDKWFEWAGLCVSFGHISTALVGFASAGCYCAHIGFGELSRQERAICPPTVKLFQHESYSDNFAELETWMHLVFGDKYRNSAAPDEGD